MSEKRSKATTILLRNQGKAVKLELFPATAWGGPEGCFRLRLDGCWHSPGGDKYQFFTPAGLARLLAGLVVGEALPEGNDQPPFGRGARVSVPTGREWPDGEPVFTATYVEGHPVLGLDGRWWASVLGRDEPVALDTVRRPS